jgi:hypothetical protein
MIDALQKDGRVWNLDQNVSIVIYWFDLIWHSLAKMIAFNY